MFRRIIVGTDPSDQALHAAHVAAEIARNFQARVTLLSVCDTTERPHCHEIIPDVLPFIEDRARIGKAVHLQALRRTGQVLKEMGVPYTSRCESGPPVETIVRVAQEQQADLIVLGSRGLSGLQRLLLGSVSEGVLSHAHCPVLVVRRIAQQQ
jgi:nucleotide-binding universal stress UspA family protein